MPNHHYQTKTDLTRAFIRTIKGNWMYTRNLEARPQVIFCDLGFGIKRFSLTLKLLVHVPATAQEPNPNQHKIAEQLANQDLTMNRVRCGERLLLEIRRLPRSAHGGYLASNVGQVPLSVGASPGLLLETKP